VNINGYVPSGSKITLTETVDGQTNNMITLDVASTETVFSIVEVDPHKNYVFSAFLTDSSGKNIGSSSQKISANMSDSQVNFVINSLAIPPTPVPVTVLPAPAPSPTPVATPVPQGRVTGRVVLNGPLDKNSQLLVLGRRVGDNDYQVWQTISNPNNEGQSWEYQGASVGQSYDIKIALQVNGNNVSTSNQVTLSVPANNVNFTLNTNFFIPSPSDSQIPSVEPCLRTGSNWETYFKFPRIDNAGQYWIQVGDSEGYSNYYNQKVAVGDGDLRLKIGSLPGGRKLYVRYTYSVCRSCSSDSNFAPWSRTIGFTCE
jgi:hypothetical protein